MRDYSRLSSTAFSREHTAIVALVVGAGALGNEVIKNLALIGVRTLWIADRDVVEASNLTRSVLFCTADIDRHIKEGTPKAVLAGQRAREINPDVSVASYVGEIADLGYGVIRRADAIFSCVDNEMARLELSWACARLRKPVVDGGLGLMNYSSGQVSVFPSEGGPCYACRKGAERRRQLLQDLQGREDPCWRKEDAIETAQGVATTPLMASVVAAFQVELALRAVRIPSSDVKGHAYQITMHPTPTLDTVTFERSPLCPLHDPESVMTNVRECHDGRSNSWTPAELLCRTDAPDGLVVFDWPITARAQCRSCGHEWEPLVRRARFRGQRCPECRDGDVVETEVLSAVSADSPWAHRTLTELGLPAGHVFEIVQTKDSAANRFHVEMTGDLDSWNTEGRR